jgi:hypothetical protein
MVRYVFVELLLVIFSWMHVRLWVCMHVLNNHVLQLAAELTGLNLDCEQGFTHWLYSINNNI